MLTFTRLVLCGAVAVAAWGAYQTRATPMISAALCLIFVGLAVFVWRLGVKDREADMFRDLSVSTLVFPPESRPKGPTSRRTHKD